MSRSIPSHNRRCLLYDQGLLPYLDALEWQRSLLQQRIKDPNLDDVLILLEHPPVYTLGQGATPEFSNLTLTKIRMMCIELNGAERLLTIVLANW